MPKKFQRTREDFTCENCGAFVEGTGYTNHCPQCLFGKHVDVNPGDRAETCGGLMRPMEVTTRRGSHTIVHKCITCGHVRPNKVARDDNFDALLEISEEISRK
jgi:hypothetical protein